MKINPLIAVSAVLLLSSLLRVFAQQLNSISVSISEIKNDQLKYDAKTVRVSGILETYDFGFKLLSNDKEDAIHLRSPSAVDFTLPVQKDELFAEFWDIRTDTGRDPPRVHYEVELDGYVSLLKANGKLVEEFTFPGPLPIELIVVRVTKIDRIDNDPFKD